MKIIKYMLIIATLLIVMPVSYAIEWLIVPTTVTTFYVNVDSIKLNNAGNLEFECYCEDLFKNSANKVTMVFESEKDTGRYRILSLIERLPSSSKIVAVSYTDSKEQPVLNTLREWTDGGAELLFDVRLYYDWTKNPQILGKNVWKNRLTNTLPTLIKNVK